LDRNFLFLFIQIYKKFFSKVSIAAVIFITILISVIGFNMNAVTFLHYSRLPWKIDSAVTALVLYIAGFYTKKAGLINRLFHHKILSAVLMLSSGIFGFYIAKYKNGYVNICDCQYSNYFYFYIAAFCGISFILLLSKFCDGIKVLQYYGRNTLWMFALHSFLLSFSVYVLNRVTQKQYVRSVIYRFFIVL
jgi:acyltransferase